MSRGIHGATNTNADGSANIMAAVPLAGDNINIISATGSLSGVKDASYKAGSAGLALDNVGRHIPNVGDQLTGAGKVNLFHNDHHDMSANAFATKTFPNNPAIPNFSTVGGGVDYMYKNTVGSSVGVAHTDLFEWTDHSAAGKLNVFNSQTSSLDPVPVNPFRRLLKIVLGDLRVD